MELEGRIRRAAAERGAVEMKKNEFEDMLEKQKRQIDTIQSLHSSQIQNVHLFYKSEKVRRLPYLHCSFPCTITLYGLYSHVLFLNSSVF